MDDPNNFKLTSHPDQKHPHRVLLYALGILLIIFIAIGSGYLLGVKNVQPVSQPVIIPPTVAKPTQSVDPTASWQTYTDSTYGYLVKIISQIFLRNQDTMCLELQQQAIKERI